MPDSPDQNGAGVSLSQEFLEGTVEAGLERIRTRLLDLTNRNRLLNFIHRQSSSIRVVGVRLDDVFKRLLDGQKSLYALFLSHRKNTRAVS